MTSLAENPPPEDSSQIETTLRLVCSMSGNHHRACWEDVTDDTPLVFGNGCVTFTSILSASFWLVECPNWMISDVMCLVDQLYKVRNKDWEWRTSNPLPGAWELILIL